MIGHAQNPPRKGRPALLEAVFKIPRRGTFEDSALAVRWRLEQQPFRDATPGETPLAARSRRTSAARVDVQRVKALAIEQCVAKPGIEAFAAFVLPCTARLEIAEQSGQEG